MTALPERIYLIGPSGSGKSTVARQIAGLTGYHSLDLDDIITERIGMSIANFFATFGEPAFRAIERDALLNSAEQRQVVVATGGGIVVDPRNWVTMRPHAAILSLNAGPEELISRIQAQSDESDIRPLLAGDALGRIRAQLDVRGPLYAQADASIATDHLSAPDVASSAVEIATALHTSGAIPHCSLITPSTRSDIWVGAGAFDHLPQLLERRWPGSGKRWIITDENVASHWLQSAETLLQTDGSPVESLVVPAGESSKSMQSVDRLVTELTSRGVHRQDVIIALGGGVVGDLAGFVAAITLRGLSIAQIPTSLLAMVDSSVGGKTGVNLPAGKNLAGAFYQPGIVIVDPRFLDTLPRDEYRSGMAEVIKHSRIQPSTPLGGTSLARLLDATPSLDPVPENMIVDLLRLNVSIKHSVVQSDERENSLRMILNFGHTAGHAIEAQGYRYRHGEAVGLGMLTVCEIARSAGSVGAEYGREIHDLLQRAGLPTALEADLDAVQRLLASDKKITNGRLRWILPAAQGGVEISSSVKAADIATALRTVSQTKAG